MMHIAICEDNKDHAQILQSMINRWAEQEKLKVDIAYYQSAEQFLFYMREDARYDLAFLDIQMNKMSGLELAKMIRKEDQTMILIFTTGLSKLAPRGYEVSAFRYLVKPLKESEISAVLTKSRNLLEQTKKDAVVVTYNGISRRIFKSDIYYIEADDHYLCIHMKEETLKFRAKMRDYEDRFQEPQFCKCHRSYIVNMYYIEQIMKDSLEMSGGAVLPISRNRWDALNKCYLAYYDNNV